MPKITKSKDTILIDFAKGKGVSIKKNTKFTAKSQKNGPVKPKKARNAYIFFLTEKSPIVKETRPDLQKVTERSSVIADLWKKLTPSEKEVYDKMAQEDKERAERDKSVYEASFGPISSPKTSSVKTSSSSSSRKKKSKTITIPLSQYSEENLLEF